MVGRETTAAAASDEPVFGESVRGLISLGLCIHLLVVMLGLVTSLYSSTLEEQLQQTLAVYGASLHWVPYAGRFHLTHGTAIDDDHRVIATGPDGSEVRFSSAGQWDSRYQRRLATRLAEFELGQDDESAARLAGALASRIMRQQRWGELSLRVERLEPVPREGPVPDEPRVGELVYRAQVFLNNDGTLAVLKQTPASEAAQAVTGP